MYKMVAEFQLVTPAFLAGAEQKSPELRVTSIKGALRFWWRARRFAGCRGGIDGMRQDESLIFGDSGATGCSAVVMKVNGTLTIANPGTILPIMDDYPGARYLGYGVMESVGSQKRRTRAGELIRGCLQPGPFQVTFISKKVFDPSFIDAVKLFGLLGGIGSRSRKGYGSVTLLRLEGDGVAKWECPPDIEAYRERLTKNIGTQPSGDSEPEYSAFGNKAKVYAIAEGNATLDLLNSIGEEMQMYRSWGRNGRVNGQASERNFQYDHDEMKNACEGTVPQGHPKRVVFGLPHNYFFSSINCKVSVSAVKGRDEIERRASPLFIHIHQFKEGSYTAVATILWSEFLPLGTKIEVSGGGATHTFEPELDLSVLDNFVKRFDQGGQRIWPK
jgi:CRISPR-associated protein Cmr1